MALALPAAAAAREANGETPRGFVCSKLSMTFTRGSADESFAGSATATCVAAATGASVSLDIATSDTVDAADTAASCPIGLTAPVHVTPSDGSDPFDTSVALTIAAAAALGGDIEHVGEATGTGALQFDDVSAGHVTAVLNTDGCSRGLSSVTTIRLNASDVSLRVPGALLPEDGVEEVGTIAPPGIPTTDELIYDFDHPAGGTYVCRVGSADDSLRWAYIAATPAGYVTGNCHDSWRMDRTRYSDPIVEKQVAYQYYGGYIYGNFDACGWIRDDKIVKDYNSNFGACEDPSRATKTFAYVVNCKPGTCSDGDHAVTQSSCSEWANVRPFSSNPSPSGELRKSGTLTVLRWRYVTPDRQWVMVRDDDIVSGKGNWFFIARSCMGPLQPGPGHSLYYP